MKRLLILFAALFAFIGCSQDEVAEPTFIPNAGDVYYASFEEFGENSRTYIDENIKLLWHEDDRISLFRTTLNEQWKFSGKTGDNAGGFVEVPSDEWVTGNPITTSYAVYPYLADTRLSNDEVLQIVLPAEQTYAENSFGRGANTMVAAAESSSSKFLPFRNAGGYLVVKLYGSDVAIKSIELKGNNNEILAGAATAEAQYGLLPLITMGAEGSTTITLNCGEGVQVGASSAEATSFWLVVPPVTFEKGFTITITDVNGRIMTKSTSKEQVIVRNEVKSMAAFESSFEGEGEDPQPETPANNEIWYTSTDGAVVAPNNSDVFGATMTSNTYENGKGVITFDGQVTAIGVEAFYNCSNLTSVIVPEGVTTIGRDAFYGCTSMQLLTLPQSVTEMGDEYDAGVFRNCTGKLIINCNIPDSYYDTSEDEYNIFYSADFTEIVVGDNVTTLGKNAFRTCGKLEALTLGRNISKYGSNILKGCANLSKIYGDYASADNRCWIVNGVLQLFAQKDVTTYNVPEYVTSIGSYVFSSCSSLQSITMPKGLSSICSYAVYNCSSLQSIYVQSEVPPTYANNAFSNVEAAQIYIPYASAEAYNVANGWKDFVLIAYDYENDKVYEPGQTPITYDWYTAVTDGVYEIDAPEEMVALSKLTNGDAEALAAVGADAAINFADMTINLTADIDLNDYCSALAGSWTPINTFSGVFNGNNHTISNLYAKTTGDAGLFGTLSSATINDVTVQGVIISSEATKVGGIASVATSAVLENCISQVNITTSTNGSYTCVGGVVGYSSNSKYIACQSTGDISDTIDEWEWMNYVGGIVGNSNGGDMLIACMKSSGNVHEEKTQSYSPVGGILGCVHDFSNISIRSCYTAISITGREPGHITNQGYYDNYNPNANIADCYYSGTPTTSKGVGTRNYGGSTKSFDYGTARSTDLAAEIVIMNEGIDEWNAANPDCICNYKYELDENNVPKLVK